jgi:hypothetical protein
MKKFLTTIIAILSIVFTLSAQTTPTTVTAKPAQEEQTFTIKAAPGLVISGLSTICKGGESILKVEGEYDSFLWNNGTTDRFLTIKEAGVYEVTVKTKGGCTITGSVNVEVVSCL